MPPIRTHLRLAATGLLVSLLGATPALALDTEDRGEVAATFETEVLEPISAVPPDPGWTGSVAACDPGDVDDSLSEIGRAHV